MLNDSIDTPLSFGKENLIKQRNPVNNAFTYLDEVEFETSAFARMRRLRLLRISYCQLTGGYEEFPKKLKWLYWHGFPSESIPNDFPLQRVVSLNMSNSKLKQIWNGPKVMTLSYNSVI